MRSPWRSRSASIETHDPDHSVDQDAPRRDHAGNSVRRLAGDGRHDPGTDQAADQRHSRPDAAADPRRAVQEPRLRQPADRADGDRDALSSCARSRRRTCRGRTTASPTPAIRRAVLLGKLNRIYGVAGKRGPEGQPIAAITASFSTDAPREETIDELRSTFRRRKRRRAARSACDRRLRRRLRRRARRLHTRRSSRWPAASRPTIASAIRS